MNLQKLYLSTDRADYPFFKDVVKRLARIFPSPLCPLRWRAVGSILLVYEIRFRDGFVLNGFCSGDVLGISEAAIIVAALCDDPDRDWAWWRATLCGAPMPPGVDFGELQNCLLGQILNGPGVCAIFSSAPRTWGGRLAGVSSACMRERSQ